MHRERAINMILRIPSRLRHESATLRYLININKSSLKLRSTPWLSRMHFYIFVKLRGASKCDYRTAITNVILWRRYTCTCRSRSIGHACVHVVIMMTRGPEDCINESESTGRSLTSRCSCCTNVVVEKRKRAKKSDKVWLEKQDSSVYTLPVLHPFKAVWDSRDFKPRKCTWLVGNFC